MGLFFFLFLEGFMLKLGMCCGIDQNRAQL